MARLLVATALVWAGCGGRAVERRPSPSAGREPAASPVRGRALAPAAPTARLALLTPGTTLHLLVLEGEVPRCRPFVVGPDPARADWLWLTRSESSGERKQALAYGYERTTTGLTLREVSRSLQLDQGREELSASCTQAQRVTERGDRSLVVGGSEWFARADDCEAALAAGAPVATSFGACELAFDAPEPAEVQAGLLHFEQVLAGGGKVYFLDEGDGCAEWEVAPDQRGVAEGVWSRTTRRGKLAETVAYGYAWSARSSRAGVDGPELSLTGPTVSGASVLDSSSWDVGSFAVIGRDRDSVELSGPAYLDRAACQADVRAARARTVWLPPAP